MTMTMTMRVAANASSLSEAALQHLSKPARAIEMEGFFLSRSEMLGILILNIRMPMMCGVEKYQKYEIISSSFLW